MEKNVETKNPDSEWEMITITTVTCKLWLENRNKIHWSNTKIGQFKTETHAVKQELRDVPYIYTVRQLDKVFKHTFLAAPFKPRGTYLLILMEFFFLFQ